MLEKEDFLNSLDGGTNDFSSNVFKLYLNLTIGDQGLALLRNALCLSSLAVYFFKC